MRHYVAIGMAACMLAAIASSASAWYFMDNGHVFPTEGIANETNFLWWVKVQLENGEDPPEVQLGIADGVGGLPYQYRDMQFTQLPDNVCYYAWQSTLPCPTEWWMFIFFAEPNHWTTGQMGPIVDEQ